MNAVLSRRGLLALGGGLVVAFSLKAQEPARPGSLKAVLDQIPRKGGTPRFLIVQDGRIVSNEFGVSNWLATMASLRKLLE